MPLVPALEMQYPRRAAFWPTDEYEDTQPLRNTKTFNLLRNAVLARTMPEKLATRAKTKWLSWNLRVSETARTKLRATVEAYPELIKPLSPRLKA